MQEKHPATKHTAKSMVILFVCLSPAGYHCKLHVCFAGLYLPASSCWFGMRVSTKTMRLRGEAPSAPLSHKPAMQNCPVLPNPLLPNPTQGFVSLLRQHYCVWPKTAIMTAIWTNYCQVVLMQTKKRELDFGVTSSCLSNFSVFFSKLTE